MLHRRTFLSLATNALLLLTVGMMAAAVFLPFMGSAAFWGDGLEPSPGPVPVVTWSLVGSSDGQIVLGLLVILAGVAASRLAKIPTLIPTAVCAAASVGAVVFAHSVVADGGRGVVPSWFFEYDKPASVEIGLYLYVTAAGLGVAAALSMLISGERGRAVGPETLRPQPS